MSEKLLCCICSLQILKDYMGWARGHNPAPVFTGRGERCCDSCNTTIVIPARIADLRRSKDENVSST